MPRLTTTPTSRQVRKATPYLGIFFQERTVFIPVIFSIGILLASNRLNELLGGGMLLGRPLILWIFVLIWGYGIWNWAGEVAVWQEGYRVGRI